MKTVIEIAGSIMRMHGLPAVHQAEYIDIIDGKIAYTHILIISFIQCG
jgi:hypothetical protein